MTEIYLHIVARMADYMATHPYNADRKLDNSGQNCNRSFCSADRCREQRGLRVLISAARMKTQILICFRGVFLPVLRLLSGV